jgi:hypothetical protein
LDLEMQCLKLDQNLTRRHQEVIQKTNILQYF